MTFCNFEQFGIGNRNAIARGIREVCALGFVELTRPGRAGNGEFRISNLFRLTYLQAHGKGPTHEWRRLRTIEEAEKIAREVRRTIKKAPPQKQNTGSGKGTATGSGKGTASAISQQKPRYRKGPTI